MKDQRKLAGAFNYFCIFAPEPCFNQKNKRSNLVWQIFIYTCFVQWLVVGSTRKQKLAFWTLRFVLDRHHHFLSFVQGGKPGKQETKGNGKGGVFHMVCLFWLLLLFFFAGGLGEASVIFCPWLQEMCWDLVKLWWNFSNVAMDHQSWSQKVCQEGLGLISRTAAWVKMMLSTIWWLWWGSFLTENSRAVFPAYNWGLG